MGTRIRLDLPDWLVQRLVRASCDSGRSIPRIIFDAPWSADLSEPDIESMTPEQRLQWVCRDIARPRTDKDDALMTQVFPGDDDDDEPVLTHEELWERLAKLPPEQWLSKAVIEDREDRF
jgi:hypothetical protein